jgi:hypothetical protein
MATDTFPLPHELIVQQGGYFEERYEDRDTTGAVVDYTGWTGVMQVRDAPGGTLRWEGSTADGRLVVGAQDDGLGTTWQVLISIPDSDTATLPAGYIGRYELRLTDTSGRPHPYLKGKISVEGAIVDA